MEWLEKRPGITKQRKSRLLTSTNRQRGWQGRISVQ
jgi:hypothetical protein